MRVPWDPSKETGSWVSRDDRGLCARQGGGDYGSGLPRLWFYSMDGVVQIISKAPGTIQQGKHRQPSVPARSPAVGRYRVT